MDQPTSCLRVNLSRNKFGLMVSVRANKIIEDFMVSLANNTEPIDVSNFGNKWIPVSEDRPILVYQIPSSQLTNIAAPRYRLDQVGRGLTLGNDIPGGENVVNLSFLRIAGISSGDGAKFLLKGTVISLDALTILKRDIGIQAKLLYQDYIRPADLTVDINVLPQGAGEIPF